MNLIFTLRIISDLCFYFTFANFFSSLSGGQPALQTLPVFALCSFISGAISEKGYIRFIPLVLLPACFIVIPLSLANFLLLLPAGVYLGLCIRNIEKLKSDFIYNEVFYTFFKVLSLFLVLMIAVGGRVHLEAASLPFALIFLISSALLMNTLRHDKDTRATTHFRIINLMQVLGIVLLGALLGNRAFFGFIGFLLRTFYFNVIAPLLMALITVIIFILRPLFNLIERVSGRIESADANTQEFEAFDGPEEAYYPDPGGTGYEVVRSIFYLLLFALAIYLIYRLFKWLLNNTAASSGRKEAPERSFSIAPGRKQGKRRLFSSNQIREIYRKFLELCRKNGIEKEPYLTSADYELISRVRFENADDSALFRSFYIKTRYGEKPPEEEEVQKMKEIFHTFRQNYKNRVR